MLFPNAVAEVAFGIKFVVSPLIPFDAKEAVVANELDSADVANEAVPNNEPVNAVEVTDVNPAIVVTVVPRLIAVLPTVTLEFARLAFVIPAVPLKLELVNPDIDPPNVIVPVLVIVPPVKVMPETDPAVATEVTPMPPTTFNAHDAVEANDADVAVVAFPDKDPENIALVSVFVVALNVNAVESTRTALFPVVPSVNAI